MFTIFCGSYQSDQLELNQYDQLELDQLDQLDQSINKSNLTNSEHYDKISNRLNILFNKINKIRPCITITTHFKKYENVSQYLITKSFKNKLPVSFFYNYSDKIDDNLLKNIKQEYEFKNNHSEYNNNTNDDNINNDNMNNDNINMILIELSEIEHNIKSKLYSNNYEIKDRITYLFNQLNNINGANNGKTNLNKLREIKMNVELGLYIHDNEILYHIMNLFENINNCNNHDINNLFENINNGNSYDINNLFENINNCNNHDINNDNNDNNNDNNNERTFLNQLEEVKNENNKLSFFMSEYMILHKMLANLIYQLNERQLLFFWMERAKQLSSFAIFTDEKQLNESQSFANSHEYAKIINMINDSSNKITYKKSYSIENSRLQHNKFQNNNEIVFNNDNIIFNLQSQSDNYHIGVNILTQIVWITNDSEKISDINIDII